MSLMLYLYTFIDSKNEYYDYVIDLLIIYL